MLEAMFEAFQQRAWMVLLGQIVLALIALMFSRRSQIDAWAESRPRLAAFHKLVRSVSAVDFWMLLQALSLFIQKRLPAPKDSSTEPRDPPDDEQPVGQVQIIPSRMPPRVPPGSAAMIGLFVLPLVLLLLVAACASSQSPRPCDEKAVAELTARCKVRVELECRDVPEEKLETDCPVIAQCDAELDKICPEEP